ncbi:MAG: YhjD/YihY/BrkB family envelope integrity protein [Bacteroidota bacterium]|nr:YhjD/YihY/BrkB family envelope integrity protein [Bacteroidota bacterium]
MKIKEKIDQVKSYFKIEIWTMDESELSGIKRRTLRFFQFISLAIAGFKEDRLNLRASALTYFTMLSIVPLLALGFGIAKGFGLEAVLENELTKGLSSQKEVLQYIMSFVKSMLETAKGGIIAGIGFVVLLWSVMKLMGNIESSFNQVWGIKKPRILYRKFTDYLSIVVVGTVLMIMSGSISVVIFGELHSITKGTGLNMLSPIFLQFAKLIPFFITWLLFGLLYIVMPNTSVKPKSAIIAGLISSIVFGIFQIGYVEVQSYTTRINAIYGSFAALPLFLIWLQISWFVILLGAEISFAVQNLKMKGNAFEYKKFSFNYEKRMALWIVKITIDRFNKGQKAFTAKQIAREVKIPTYTIEKILNNLQKSDLISKIYAEEEHSYQPAQAINRLSVFNVIDAYENNGDDLSKHIKNRQFKRLDSEYSNLQEVFKKSDFNKLLKDIKE